MIYADYNGSAPLLPSVKEYLQSRLTGDLFANPSSLHFYGVKIKKRIEGVRAYVAQTLGCRPDQLFFTSGSSESAAQVFYSLLSDSKKAKGLISGLEHSCIEASINQYASNNFEINTIKTKPTTQIDLEDLKEKLSLHKDYAFLCINSCHSETGVLTPIKKISTLKEQHAPNLPYICDLTQSIAKVEIDLSQTAIDFAFFSSHKLGALGGLGVLYAKEPALLKSLIPGAGQERGIRGGTENYLAIETLAVALQTLTSPEFLLKKEKLENAKIEFEKKLQEALPNLIILGQKEKRIYNTTYLSAPSVHSQAVQIELESEDIFVSTSTACADNEPFSSSIILAAGLGEEIGRGALRISLSPTFDSGKFEQITSALIKSIQKIANSTIFS